MDEEMREFVRSFEKKLIIKLMREDDIPDDIITLVKCLADAGCPVKCVLQGLQEFGEEMQLKELLKGLPIKLEDD